MRLHYKPGACSLAPHIVLNELAVPFELDKTDLSKGLTESGESFLAISPNGYVPVLRTDAGDVITENPAVLQYLADLAPEGTLAPKAGTLERVRLQELLNFLSSELHKAFSPFFSTNPRSAEATKRVESKLARRIDHVEERLGDRETYLQGDSFTIADAYAFVLLNWAGFIGFSLDRWPRTQAYLARIGKRPSIVKAMVAEGLMTEVSS
jgi:glutathione S-transferase